MFCYTCRSSRMIRTVLPAVLAVLLAGALGACKKDEGPPAPATDSTVDAAKDMVAADTKPLEPKSYRELLGGEITEKVRLVLDARYEGEVDVGALKEYVLSRQLREADDYTTLTAAPNWWDDYQDFAEILYYSAEHVFSEEAPYPGSVFMPHIWNDVTYRVREVTVEFADLSAFYEAIEPRKMTRTDPAGTTWTLLSANDGMAWAVDNYAHAPDEMVVLVTYNETYKDLPYSYYFFEEKYAEERSFEGHYFNVAMNQWPTEIQEAEGLTPHNLPIWMHFAFLNGEWDEASKSWRLFQSTRWGAYEDANIYFIEGIRDFHQPVETCDAAPEHPESHYANDEVEFKRCKTFTERLEHDWYRLWRHAFNVPSFPFWWTEKVDLRVVVVDLRGYVDGVPEYEEEDVIDWQTFEDTVREANPFVDLTVQRYSYVPPPEIREVLVANLIQEADYPMHSAVDMMNVDGTWRSFTMDWHYHFDISGLPGMQVYIADKLREYFGGVDAEGAPAEYNPFAEPYHRTGVPFVMPAIFFLTPFNEFEGTVGGWTANTGNLMCVLAGQYGLSCEQIHEFMEQWFGQPVGPNLNAWSDAYGLWWEIFIVDWTYSTSPVNNLRWILDPPPFADMLALVPEIGGLLNLGAPMMFDDLFGRFHPWATGFPFWLKESLSDDDALALSRQFASYQFAETIQHNIGYKHQTTVIFDCPYLGMEEGYDYRRHKDLKETFEMTAEGISMPFYSTEPGSRDFPIDANSYMTHKMGAGTRHMLQRIFARREVMALFEQLDAVDPGMRMDDEDFQKALASYLKAAGHALAWEHEAAYDEALIGLEHLDRYHTARGEPDRLHTDWDAEVTFTPAVTGMDVTPEDLDKDLKKIGGM